MDIPKEDKKILQELGKEVAEISAMPIHKENAERWKQLNGLQRVKPLIWINEIPWHELNVDDELTLSTSRDFCRNVETQLRQILYQWRHMPGDMIVEPKINSPVVINFSGFGIHEDVDIARVDENSPVISRDFHPQIQDEDDIYKIKAPEVSWDPEATEENYQAMLDIFDGILEVEKIGMPGFWFAPWDQLIRWWGVEEAMIDMVMRPQLVHKAMDRLLNAYLSFLDQLEEQGLLSLNNGNYRIGSGGLGYTDELPGPSYDASNVKAKNLWGCATAQIFSEVSPKMHEEFALQYEIRFMERFGLNYYGCCEPLHKKIDILKKVPNLRKISMSRWINVEEAVFQIGDEYVFSYKPNPAFLAADSWNIDAARTELIDVLNKTKGCVVEIILKDISTVKYKPQRLWEWEKMAREVVESV